MKPLTKIVLVCAAIVLGGYAVCSAIYPTLYLRYRLTVDVDVDGVTHTGSGVVEISYVTRPQLSEIDGMYDPGHLHGYAITVDLGERGLLFVVDRGSDVVDPTTHRLLFPELTDRRTLPLKVAGFRYFGGPAVGDLKTVFREIQLKKGPRDIPFDILPMLLCFRDINDQYSLQEVNPLDLASALGPGVRLARATFEVTDDPVTPKPRTWPKWLTEYNNTMTRKVNDRRQPSGMKLVSLIS